MKLKLVLMAVLALRMAYAQTIKDLASICTVSQSSDYNTANRAMMAIDNDPNTVAITEKSYEPWWQADLGSTYTIQTVTITNRMDCCGERLGLYDVRVGNYSDPFSLNNVRCPFVPYIANADTRDIFCNGLIGRYISVSLPGRSEYLQIAEVKISRRIPEDLAQIAHFTQSSQYNSAYPPENAIDGNVNTIFHTLQDMKPWWRASLPRSFAIQAVRITNRADAYGDRLRGYEVRIGDNPEPYNGANRVCAENPLINQGETGTIRCNGLVGRYVYITQPLRNEFLHVAEVRIIPVDADNLASSAVASHTSTYAASNSADHAIDGFLSTLSITSYIPNPWLRIDLNTVKSVHEVAITNRIDCCGDRLRGYEVRVGNDTDAYSTKNKVCPYNPMIPMKRTGSAACTGIKGRYVYIVIPSRSEYLSIQEVRISSVATCNIAQYGEARQSSDLSTSYPASNAIDNDPSTFSHTSSQYQPWWRLDLMSVYRVYNVLLRFRQGCCNSYLDGYKFQIGNYSDAYNSKNVDCLNAPMVNAGQTAVIHCQGRYGRYLFVVLPGRTNYINIGEVEVNAIKCEQPSLFDSKLSL